MHPTTLINTDLIRSLDTLVLLIRYYTNIATIGETHQDISFVVK